jgi:flavodoxin
MKKLIIFDSYFGNTKRIAEEIAAQLGDDVKVVSVKEIKEGDTSGQDLIVVGSPIRGWMPSEGISGFLSRLKKDQLKGIKAAAFDTRVKIFIHGDAAGKISKALKGAGAELISEEKAFYVNGKEGPLLDGEIENAREWGREIKGKM